MKEGRKKEKGENPKSQKEQKKEGFFWNTFFILCIILSIILIIISSFCIMDFNKNIKRHNVNYNWPKLSELLKNTNNQ